MTEKDQVLSSNYDGIKEFDNELPKWWVQLFWLTIVFSIVYSVWFHAPSTPTPTETLKQEMESLAQLRKSFQPASSGEDKILSLTSNSAAIAKGKDAFAAKCVVCHGPEGQGLVGPNLTDKNWIHGGKISDILRTVREGVPEKGMLAWKDLISADELDSVVAFVWSIRNTTPPNPKAPEGALVE